MERWAQDLEVIAALAADPTRLDELFVRALDSLSGVVPYDLAAVLELREQVLVVRHARGRLATEAVRAHRIALRDFPTLRRAIETREPRVLHDHDHAGPEGDPYDGILDLPHGHSCMVVPLYAGDETLGVMTFDRAECGVYPEPTVRLAGITGQLVALAIAEARRAALLELYRARLEEHNRLLQEELSGAPSSAGELLEAAPSAAMRELLRQARQVAPAEVPVLIHGETGTGKELLAAAIHDWSGRRDAPFVKINCAALPEALIESELFGHTRGAFSGATQERPGRFRVADRGTLLLDEVGELPLEAQAKLLRVIQEGTLEPVGSDTTFQVDVRILAATHVDLEAAVAAGRFREDLYYRLQVFPLTLPPLRERLADLPAIAETLLADIRKRTGRGPWQLTPGALSALREHDWPGNIRELRNALERATILQPQGALEVALSPTRGAPRGPRASPEASAGGRFLTMDEMQRRYIEEVLEATEGRIYGDGGAAERLGMKPSTLQSRMKKLGVRRP